MAGWADFAKFIKTTLPTNFPLFPVSKGGTGAGTPEQARENLGAAPAGYGLGAFSKELTDADDLNTVNQSGWYSWGESIPKNAPTLKYDGGYSRMQVDGGSEGSFTQTIYSSYSTIQGIEVRRTFSSGNTDGWEWVNPPMYVGIEYRTTERWDNKPVYAKRFNFGALPNASAKYVNFDGTGQIAQVISCTPIYTVIANNAVYVGDVLEVEKYYAASVGNMCIKTNADADHVNAEVIVKYVKK
jgi:hypothetical protein